MKVGSDVLIALAALGVLALAWVSVRALRRRLSREERFLSTVLSTMNALVVVVDPEGRILRFNAACERLTGYSEAEVKGKKPWETFVPERERHSVTSVFKQLKGGSVQEEFENHWIDRNGRERLIAWRNASLIGTKDEVELVIATGIDITEQRRMDLARHALYTVAKAAEQVSDPDELYPVIHRALGSVMDVRNFFVALIGRDDGLLRFPYLTDEKVENPGPIPPGKTLTAHVLRTGRPLLATPDVFEELVNAGEVEVVGAQAIDWMGVPLRRGGEVVGVLAVQSYDETVRYTKDDLDLLSFVAGEVARSLERVESSRALREREARYRQLFEQAPVGIFHYDTSLVFTACNEAMAAMLGSTPERIVGLSMRRLRDTRILPALVAAIEGKNGRYEGWYRPTTGQRTVWGVLRTAPTRDAEGRVSGGIAIVEDQTKRKDVEQTLARRSSILEAISDAGRRFLESDNPEDVIEDVLEGFGRATGVSGVHVFTNRTADDGELISRHRVSWMAGGIPAPERVARVLKEDLRPQKIGFGRWEELMSSGETIHGPVSTLPRSERRLLVKLGIRSVAVFPILVNGGWWGFLLFEDREQEQDWTQIELAALQLAADTLGVAMQHRIVETQLRGARKLEAIGQLAGGIAHDFNNLLMAIRGAIERIEGRGGFDPDVEEGLRLIEEMTERAATMTRRLLAFARRQVIEPKPVNLNQLFEQFVPAVRRLIPENISIDTIPARDLGWIMADPNQIEQIIMNLCINARDAMPEGGTITIETENVVVNGEFVATHPWAKKGRYVLFSVTDTGVGMDEETRRRAFEPFFTTKPQGKGTGMGLATVYGIVKQHGGMVHIYSEPGRGTTIKVYLPQSERRAAEVGTKIEGPVVGGSEVILIVEDDPAVREVMEGLLEDLGYEVLIAEEGKEALRILAEKQGRVDLVISDIVMPTMGGKELFDLAQRQWPHIPFLFTTGYSENVIHTQFVKKEGISFLTKPFGRDVLARKVREMLT